MSKDEVLHGPAQVNAHPAPLVSVIVPVFNGSATLAETLESVLAQTLTRFELIIVNDGSTDTTGQIIREFARRDPRIRACDQPNGGVSRARNTGLAAARAPYVAQIDADDLWHPTYLERMIEALDQADEDAAFAYASYREIDAQSRVTRNAEVYGVCGSARNRFLEHNYAVNGSGYVARRSLALAVGGFDARLTACEDNEFLVKMADQGSVVAVPQYLVGYRRIPGSLSMQADTIRRAMFEWVQIVVQHVGGLDPKVLRAVRARSSFRLSMAAFRARRWNEAWTMLRYAVQDVRNGPVHVIALKLLEHKERIVRQVLHLLGQAPEKPDFLGLGPDVGLKDKRRRWHSALHRIAARADARESRDRKIRQM